MSSYEIDGVTLPEPVAGRPVLDFCNTRAGWNAPRQREYLVDSGVLALWAAQAGLISPQRATELRVAPEISVLERALRLREALYPVLLGRGTEADWAVVSHEATRARSQTQLLAAGQAELPAAGQAQQPAGPAALGRWHLPPTGPDTALLAVAAAAADFLTTPRVGLVAACPGEGCGWLFSDPRGRRRWCSMAVCGNRAKARRHRASS